MMIFGNFNYVSNVINFKKYNITLIKTIIVEIYLEHNFFINIAKFMKI